MKKTYLLAALGVGALVSVPLIAQTMAERTQSRTEVAAHVQKLFAMMDANHDGVLDQTELAARGDQDGGAHEGHMPMDRNAMFDMIDTNKDGNISRDEFARAPMPHHEGMGAMGEHHGKGGGMARMMAMADADHDGKVTLAEANSLALQHFDKMDTNHDGKVTPEEREAARGMMKQMRGQ